MERGAHGYICTAEFGLIFFSSNPGFYLCLHSCGFVGASSFGVQFHPRMIRRSLPRIDMACRLVYLEYRELRWL